MRRKEKKWPSYKSTYTSYLTLEKEYVVYGICQIKNEKYYLINSDARPDFLPSVLFEITSEVIPNNWIQKSYLDSKRIMVNGFPDLANDLDYVFELADGNRAAIRKFLTMLGQRYISY